MQDIFSKDDISLYSNAMTFMRAPYQRDPRQFAADVAILGVPFDMATSGRPGSRLGPDAIRRASVNLSWEGQRFPWPFKLSERLSLVDAGDLVFDCGDAQDFSSRLQFAAEQIIQSGKALLSFGGDHFISLPLLRAHHAHYGKMALVHFDAHTDTYSNGSEYDHGTMFYRAPQEGLIDVAHSVQIGIRTEYEQDNHGFTVINAMEANDASVADIVERIKQTIGDLPVYLTFDIDCLDPAFAPGTGTPVCGGLSTDKVLKIIRALQGINLVGMDVVEVAPGYDHSDVTALAAATIALDLLHIYSAKS